MADEVLTSSLEQTRCKLFFGTQVLPKNRGACVDTRFWHDAKCNKDGLKWKGFWHKKVLHCRVEQLWYLGQHHPTSYQGLKLFSKCQDGYSKWYLADYALKMISYEKTFYMNWLRLVESVDFHIKIVQIRGRMQPAETKQDQAVFSFRVKILPSEKILSEWNPAEWK